MEKDKELFCKEKTSFKGVILVCRQCGSVKDDFDKSNFCNSCGCGIFISKEEYTKEKLIKFTKKKIGARGITTLKVGVFDIICEYCGKKKKLSKYQGFIMCDECILKVKELSHLPC